MSIFDTITRGKTPKPPIILLYGQEGVGKSTFAAKAPNTIFIPTEDGLNEIDCAKFPISKSYGEFKEKLLALRDEEHEFQTLAIDSISAPGYPSPSSLFSLFVESENLFPLHLRPLRGIEHS